MLNKRNDTTLTVAEIEAILASVPGSKARLARLTNKDATAISHWLHGRFTSARIHRAANTLARRIAKKQNPGGTQNVQPANNARATKRKKEAPQNAPLRTGASAVPVSTRVA